MRKNNIYAHKLFIVADFKKPLYPDYPDLVYESLDSRTSERVLNIIESDDELAGLLSNNIAETVNAHYVRKSAKFGIVYPIFLAEVYFTYGTWCPISNFLYNCWTKNYHYEADITGVDLMVKAGYDPNGMLIIYDKVMNNPEFEKFWISKPPSKNRIAMVNEYIKIKYPQFKNSSLRKKFEEESALADLEVKGRPKIDPALMDSYYIFMTPMEDL